MENMEDNIRAAGPDEKPSEMVVNMVPAGSALDSKGRLITVKRLNALQFYRLAKAMAGTSTNEAAMDLATLASSVVKIDATPVLFPSNERDVEFLIQQLDFHGIAAAGDALKSLSDDGIEAAKN